tara:strand:- start:1270 stop:2097 length:828 start_codon:yes stop_codon:yes gene_type:complete
MKLIIFTTCKPFIGDDAWRQEQAIKSWTLLEGIEKKIIILGNDEGTKEICDKYNLIHEPDIRTLQGVPYLYDMFLIANNYANDEDVMLWTNSDMIYFQDMIDNILSFKKYRPNEKNYLLVSGRIDWYNPKILEKLDKQYFYNNINLNNKYTGVDICFVESKKFECCNHPLCGIDYVIHSKSTFLNNIDKNLVIAGTRHDMIMLGVGINKNYFTCDITSTCPVIHQNHGYNNVNQNKATILRNNNFKCLGNQRHINESTYKTRFINDDIQFTYSPT